MTQDTTPFDIHVLGLGSVGILVAHSLASLPTRPCFVVLLPRPATGSVAREKLVDLELVRDGLSTTQEQVSVEEIPQDCHPAERLSRKSTNATRQHESDIMCLIVTLKANFVAETLQKIKHRLLRDSTILFLQNGMGVTDEVDREVFPNPETRPFYLTGVNWHGTRRTKPFCAEQMMTGPLFYGPALRTLNLARYAPSPNDICADAGLPASARLLVRTLDKTREGATLNACFTGLEELVSRQLWKFSCNSIFNPLTALGDCSIGTVMARMPDLVARIVREMSEVYLHLPWPETIKQQIEFDYSYHEFTKRLYLHSQDIAHHKTSMWRDIQNCADTEIQYLTGHVITIGKAVNVSCKANEAILEMIISLQKEGRRKLVSGIGNEDQIQKSLMKVLNPPNPCLV